MSTALYGTPGNLLQWKGHTFFPQEVRRIAHLNKQERFSSPRGNEGPYPNVRLWKKKKKI